MTAWVEVLIKGNVRAYIDSSAVAAILTSPSQTSDFQATADEPMSLVMRGGDVLEGIYGISPDRLMLNLAGVKMIERADGRIVVVAYLDQQADLEAQIAHHLDRRVNRDG